MDGSKRAPHPFGRGRGKCPARECERARWPKVALPRVYFLRISQVDRDFMDEGEAVTGG
jgi:hypothetical protein